MSVTAPPQAFVLLNPKAAGGRSQKFWQKVLPHVSQQINPQVTLTDLEHNWQANLKAAITKGIKHFVAAGGDGTVNSLINALVRLRGSHSLDEFVFGAVGLGSSNDFHKPYKTVIKKIPLKVDPQEPGRRDVCRARFLTDGNIERVHHFIVSASLGVTAEANAFFNQGNRLQRWLKKRWTGGAIIHAALHTIKNYSNIKVRLNLPINAAHEISLTNLAVTKTPYLSGSLKFDTPVYEDDGLFAVNLAEDLSKPACIRLLSDLSRGKFLGRPGRRYWHINGLTVEAEKPFALELDGEIFSTTRVVFEILSERIGQCR
jgi:diacylglycerol kinase family enzyme